ncbi:molecular chaperone GrpE [Sorangium cellulosum]|uniref:Protein GrpE n=1 Tax=Sorangium cellulosum TaxID=56 RepID=A0A150PV24_SORCE|nr:molecular chaperone GrpE [Sorangium cellulosum]
MSDSEQNGSSQNTEEQAEVQAERAEPAEQRAPTLEDKLAEAQAEAARTREQLLRTAADFDNFRKRSRREVEEAQRRGRESILKDLLPVFDNLERAASHAESAPDVKSVAEGVRIVAKQFVDTLDRMGIKRIPAVGKPFDPSVHEAIQQIESTEHPAGVVIAEVQPGYILGDYLIRAAMVVVSKGSPGGEPSTSEAN